MDQTCRGTRPLFGPNWSRMKVREQTVGDIDTKVESRLPLANCLPSLARMRAYGTGTTPICMHQPARRRDTVAVSRARVYGGTEIPAYSAAFAAIGCHRPSAKRVSVGRPKIVRDCHFLLTRISVWESRSPALVQRPVSVVLADEIGRRRPGLHCYSAGALTTNVGFLYSKFRRASCHQ